MREYSLADVGGRVGAPPQSVMENFSVCSEERTRDKWPDEENF